MESFVWLGAAAVLALVEVLSFGLVTVWFVIGALAAFVACMAGSSMMVQLAVFLVVSLACLVLVRPLAVRYCNRGASAEPTNVGRTAVVVEEISPDGMSGRVELPSHMTWAAASQSGEAIPVGTSVVVTAQESVKLIVERKGA